MTVTTLKSRNGNYLFIEENSVKRISFYTFVNSKFETLRTGQNVGVLFGNGRLHEETRVL
jgi:hypothetical protein